MGVARLAIASELAVESAGPASAQSPVPVETAEAVTAAQPLEGLSLAQLR